ncbi:MAG: hypothetical protein ACFFED_01680 [Candidatus Thorarchaeota archaeon]
MRVLVVGSCGKRKRFNSPKAPTCSEITGKADLPVWVERLSPLTCAARDMYTGNQARELGKGVALLRSIKNVEVHYYIISAGFGLLHEDEPIPPYECSFSSMRKLEIRERSRSLSIPDEFRRIISQRFDFSYIALGSKYIIALDDGWHEELSGTIVFFGDGVAGDNLLRFPSNAEVVKAFSSAGHKIHGVAGFKGDLLRILAQHALLLDDPYTEIANWTLPGYLTNIIKDLVR